MLLAVGTPSGRDRIQIRKTVFYLTNSGSVPLANAAPVAAAVGATAVAEGAPTAPLLLRLPLLRPVAGAGGYCVTVVRDA